MPSYIYACEYVPPELSPFIEPIEAPLPFRSVSNYETWLREVYIPRTLIPRIIDDPGLPYIVHANKTECWGIFSSNEEYERSCQVYPKTNLEKFPEFENSLRGKIFSHNHLSSDSTLSIREVLLWANLQMKEIRAVTENCTYIIKPLNQNWPNPNSLFNEMKNICPILNFDPSLKLDGELRHMCYQILARERYFVYEYF